MSQMDQKPSQQGPGMGMNINNMGMAGGIPAGMDGNPQRGAGNSERQSLNTYIYDYFIKNDMLDCAKALLKTPAAEVQVEGNFPNSSVRTKHEGDMNGVDDDAMDAGDRQGDDGDDAKSVKDLPQPKVPSLHGSFLLEWWCCFTDIYWARNKVGSASNAANAYVNNTQAQQRLRNEQLMRLGPQQMIGNVNYQNRIGMIPNGVMHAGQEPGNNPGDFAHKQGQPLQRTVLQRMTASGQRPQPIVNRPQMMPNQRGEGDLNDMNGQQARPPSTAPAAASPGNKRVRLDNGQYEQLGNGRGGGAPQGPPNNAQNNAATAHQLLIANGINPDQLTPQQFAAFQGQAPTAQLTSIREYAQRMAAATGKNISALQQGPKMPQTPGQAGSPMMPQTSEGALGGSGMGEFYPAGPGAMRNNGSGLGAGVGNHALQDYQMQLMMLEQQNKKRLMMARQEQDNISHGDTNRPGAYPQGMSPGSRAAPSPGPGGKPNMVGTPKMNQVGPGSPLPEGQMAGHVQQRSSPAAAVQFNGQMTEGQHQLIYQKQMENMGMMGANPGGVPNGAGMMRPPNFNGQMGQPDGMPGQMNPNMARVQQQQAAGRGQPGGMWQQHPQQMQQPGQQSGQQPNPQQQQQQQQQPGGGQQGQPQQVGTPQQVRQGLQHSNMPPPQPPQSAVNPGRPAPASPQVSNQQPPTPTQVKVSQKGKGARDTGKKPRQTKKGAAQLNAVTPTASGAATATSEPPTPTTPQGPTQTFNAGRTSFTSSANPTGNTPMGQTQPPNSGPAAAQTGVDPTADSFGVNFDDNPFGLGSGDPELGLDGFDFDSFLNTSEEHGISFGGDTLQWADPLDAGPNEA